MTMRIDGLSPYLTVRAVHISKEDLIAFWNELRATDDIGETTWEVLEPIEREVTECLDRAPSDIGRAVSLTYKAHLLIAGLVEL